jgi:hypothetical protein
MLETGKSPVTPPLVELAKLTGDMRDPSSVPVEMLLAFVVSVVADAASPFDPAARVPSRAIASVPEVMLEAFVVSINAELTKPFAPAVNVPMREGESVPLLMFVAFVVSTEQLFAAFDKSAHAGWLPTATPLVVRELIHWWAIAV